MIASDLPLPALLKLFSDSTRLRLMALLERQELSVGELGRSVGMAQSRVSNHLRILREAGLLSERHVGTSTYIHLAPSPEDHGSAVRVWQALREELDGLTEHRADLVRLESVLSDRRNGTFFDRVAGDWDKIAGDFETGQARQRVAAHLLPRDLVVADLGCGQGYFADTFLGHCSRLICVDRSRPMLEEARKSLRSGIGTDLQFVLGEVYRLPLCENSVDGVVVGMVLHHLAEMDSALNEIRRVVRPGGSIVVVELAPHREDWMQATLGDRHLGLEAADVVAGFRRAGFSDVVLDAVQDRYRPMNPKGEVVSLPLYIVRGRVPQSL